MYNKIVISLQVHLFNILVHNSYTLQNTQINQSIEDIFHHQNNMYTTNSKQLLGQAGNKLEQQYMFWYVITDQIHV